MKQHSIQLLLIQRGNSKHPDNSNDNRAERMSTRYAFVLLAAHLLNRFYDFQIEQEELLEFILDNERQNMREIGRAHV